MCIENYMLCTRSTYLRKLDKKYADIGRHISGGMDHIRSENRWYLSAFFETNPSLWINLFLLYVKILLFVVI